MVFIAPDAAGEGMPCFPPLSRGAPPFQKIVDKATFGLVDGMGTGTSALIILRFSRRASLTEPCTWKSRRRRRARSWEQNRLLRHDCPPVVNMRSFLIGGMVKRVRQAGSNRR